MNVFLTLAVYSLRISSDMPLQSDYLPDITAYFLSAISLNMVTFFWVVYLNRCSTKGEMPRCLEILAVFLKKYPFRCLFPVVKTKDKPEDENTDEKNVVQYYYPFNGSHFITHLKKPEKSESKKKLKCRLCDRCETCESETKKDKDKSKDKKELESKLEAVNYLVFIILFLAMVSVQLGIWLGMNRN